MINHKFNEKYLLITLDASYFQKRTIQESEEEIEPEDALSLMFNYFDKKFEVMQA